MNTTAHFSQYIGFREFERDFNLSRRTFFLWTSEGKLPAYRPSKRKTLVKRADVERLLEASKTVCDVDKIVDDVMSELSE